MDTKNNVVVITRHPRGKQSVNVNGEDVHNAVATVAADGQVTLEFYTSQLIIEEDKHGDDQP